MTQKKLDHFSKFINALAAVSVLSGALAPLIVDASPKAAGYVVLVGAVAGILTQPVIKISELVKNLNRVE